MPPNADFNEDFNKRRQSSPAKRQNFSGKSIGFNMSMPKWGGLPGKSQPKNRGKGTPQAKIHPQSKGL